ncbi:MAG: glycosyltransferase family 2 protein [Bacteroidetes bacterium]|nr:glycosyltransferase family 2 protein [Bacteroidota bacterium]
MLSAVIITFNEEKNITRCLQSLAGVADEIIVVDSFSTDKTKEICLSYGATFIEHKFDGHIQQKNWAKEQASHKFVLSLDADEALDETLSQSILAIKANPKRDGYYMNRFTNYCGHWVRHCGWYPDKKLRLWNPTKGKWGGMNPHDRFELDAGDANAGYLKGNILHYSYYSIEEHYQQAEKFSTISAQSYFERGRRTNPFLIFIKPIGRFLISYFLKLGFLDGKYGFIICRIQAHEVNLKYRKLYALQKMNK